MWLDSAVLQSLTSLAIWTLAAGMAFLLGRSTARGGASFMQPLPLRADARAQTRLPVGAAGSAIQQELLAAAQAAANADGALILATANQAAMLHQMPIFMAALHGQPESPPVADSLVMITFDVVAHRLCVRQHRAHLCVLDSFETTKLGVDPASLADSLRASAGWGSAPFRVMTWRKPELVHDLLLQGFSVLSSDLDITLFKNPLSPQVNPWMRPEVEMIVAQDESVTGMFNCGFYFARPVPSVMAFFKLWLGAAHDVPNPLDVWEQAVYNETLHSNPTGIRRHTLGQTWFADLCFYRDVRAALVLNAGAVIDAHVFGDAFDGMMDVLDGWDTIFGFHTPCCYSGNNAYPEPASQECKAVANSLSLLRWQRHQKPWDRLLERQGGLPEHDDLSGSHAQQGRSWSTVKDLTLRLAGRPVAVKGQAPGRNGTDASASDVASATLPSLDELETIRLKTQEVRDRNKNKILRKVKPFGRREADTLN